MSTTVKCRDCTWTYTGPGSAAEKQLATHELIHPNARRPAVNLEQDVASERRRRQKHRARTLAALEGQAHAERRQ